jgi:menaquinone-specific isochorismate synthase
MHTSTDTLPIRRQLKDRLRQALAQAPSSSRVMSFTLPLAQLDLVDWLSTQSLFPRLFWQARNSPVAYGGIGAAVRVGDSPKQSTLWAELETLTHDNPEITLFGGMRFDVSCPSGEEWRAFGDYTFILPRFVIEQDDAQTVLRCNVLMPEDGAIESVTADIEREIDTLIFDAPHLERPHRVHADVHEQPPQPQWMDAVRHVTGSIEQGTVEKVVLARRMDVTFSEPPNPFVFIRNFAAMKSPAYFFCLQLTPERAFVGSSPERMYKRSKREVISESLAGTRRRGATDEEDAALATSLLTSTKDLHEHQLVDDHIQRALGPLCETLEDAKPPTVLQLVLVQHLLCKTAGRLRGDASDRDLTQALHPTPAVGGVPTETALAKIRELEPFDRGWYAAPFGAISRDAVDLTVAIRSGLLHGKALSLYCGAGIVDASDPKSEWDETKSKFANFLHVIHVE